MTKMLPKATTKCNTSGKQINLFRVVFINRTVGCGGLLSCTNYRMCCLRAKQNRALKRHSGYYLFFISMCILNIVNNSAAKKMQQNKI